MVSGKQKRIIIIVGVVYLLVLLFGIFSTRFYTDENGKRRAYQLSFSDLRTQDDYNALTDALKEAHHKVDYIITHTAPQTIIRMMNYSPRTEDAELTGFFDWVWHEVEFDKWFFGHWHDDLTIADKARLLWFDIEHIG